MRVVSFCIYGSDSKYRTGLLKNLALLPEGFVARVVAGSDVDDSFVDQLIASGAQVERRPYTGPRLLFDRLAPLDHPDVELCFVRDADSRIGERDRWCMRAFERSDARFHVIRDHFFHKSRIMAGTCGGKRGCLPGLEPMIAAWIDGRSLGYGVDEQFLSEVVYPRVRPLIHTNIVGYRDEETSPIELPESDDFTGNVYDDADRPRFRYDDYPFEEHIKWLQSQDQWRLIAHNLPIERASGGLLFPLFQAFYYLGRFRDAQAVLARYQTVGEHEIVQSSYLIPKIAERVTGTTDVDRVPGHGEAVVVYGNFLHDVDALPHSSLIFRHAIYSRFVRHSSFEHHPCWEPVGQIYVLNLETRADRFAEVMAELARMNAPLDRVVHYKAQPDENRLVASTVNHIEVIRHFLATGSEACAIFEDDFTFTSRIAKHQADLASFWARKYEFDVCLLATSKYYERRPHDDLLELSFQECTTSSGYLLHRSTAGDVLAVMEEGLELLRQGDVRGVVDRYWAKLQPRGKFFVFRTKFGYQRCGYSDIKHTVTAYFD